MTIVQGIILIYMVVVLGIGFWTMFKTKSASDFFIAGKSIGVVAVAMASFSAAISGFVFVGGPGLAYSVGLGSLWLTFPATISFCMAWVILSKKMRMLASTHHCMTVADAVYARFNCRKASFMAALASAVGLLLYLATQVSAFAFILQPIFGLSFKWAVVLGMVVVLIYSVAGGMLAGVYTDVFQGSMMMITSAAVMYFALKTGGSVSTIMTDIATNVKPEFVGPWGILPSTMAIGWFFCFAIGILGQPHVVHKFYMIKDIKKLKWGALIASFGAVMGAVLWLSVGLVVKQQVALGNIPALTRPDNAVVVFLTNFTPKILAGMVYAGIASAVMSTADSFLNISSAAVVRDIPNALKIKLTNKQELFYGRIFLVVLSALTLLIAFTLGTKGVALLGAFGWGTFAAALAPVIGIGLNWKRATKNGAMLSIVVGLGLNLILEISKTLGLDYYNHLIKPLGLYNGTLSMVVSAIVFIGVSYLEKPQPVDKDMDYVMDA